MSDYRDFIAEEQGVNLAKEANRFEGLDEFTNGDDICGWVVESCIKALTEKNEVIRKKSSIVNIRKKKNIIEKKLGCKIEIIKLEKPKTFLIRKVGD